MESETFLKILKVLIDTAKYVGELFMILPWPVQVFVGFITVMLGGTIAFRLWIFWNKLKALRYGRVW